VSGRILSVNGRNIEEFKREVIEKAMIVKLKSLLKLLILFKQHLFH